MHKDDKNNKEGVAQGRVFLYAFASTLTLAVLFPDFFFTLVDPAFNPFNYLQATLPVVIYSNFYEDEVRLKKENKNKGGVYHIINTLNNKSYVGSSANLQRRFREYFNLSRLTSGVEKDRAISRALIKYGYASFRLEILEYCKKEECLSREQYYIDLFKPEYNILLKAGSPLGFKKSYEQVFKVSGKNHFNYGKNQSEALKESIRQAISGDKNYFYGQTHTDASKTKMSLANQKRVSIVVNDRELNKETIYDSKLAAARALDCSRPALEYQIKKGGLLRGRYEVKVGERLTREPALEVVNEKGDVKYTFLSFRECAAFFELSIRTIKRRLSKQIYFNYKEGESLKIRYRDSAAN